MEPLLSKAEKTNKCQDEMSHSKSKSKYTFHAIPQTLLYGIPFPSF